MQLAKKMDHADFSYLYEAHVLAIVDADTFDLNVDALLALRVHAPPRPATRRALCVWRTLRASATEFIRPSIVALSRILRPEPQSPARRRAERLALAQSSSSKSSSYSARVAAARAVQLHGRASQMRFSLTPPEAKLWEAIRAGQLCGVQFRRQVVIGRFVADFCAVRERLVVEVDGQQHAKRRSADARRDAQLGQLGFAVLRLPASDVELRFALCRARIVDALGR